MLASKGSTANSYLAFKDGLLKEVGSTTKLYTLFL